MSKVSEIAVISRSMVSRIKDLWERLKRGTVKQ
jgi:hypothetical protein